MARVSRAHRLAFTISAAALPKSVASLLTITSD
jgi:hypothetical protein